MPEALTEAAAPPPALKEAPPPEEPAPPRKRRPLNESQRQAKADRARVRKELRRLEGVANVDELGLHLAELRQRLGAPEASPASPSSATAPAEPSAPAAPTARAGWPSDEAVAQLVPTLYLESARLLGRIPEPYRPSIEEVELTRIVPGPDGPKHEKTRVIIDPAQRLAQGLAPWAAKMTEGAQTTPERLALFSVVLVLGFPLAHLAFDKVGVALAAWWRRRRPPGAVVKLAEPEPKPETA